MIRLYLSITLNQMQELKEHLCYNGYHFEFIQYDILEVDSDEAAYVETILNDRGIGYTIE